MLELEYMKLIKDKKKHLRTLEGDDLVYALKMLGNKYRLNMLVLLSTNPGLTLDQINEKVGGDFKNISMHMTKLSKSGLVYKNHKGKYVLHSLTRYGTVAVKSFRLFQQVENVQY